MIRIKKIYIKKSKKTSSLICDIELGALGRKELFFKVDNEYAQYLCYERADAFLIAILPYAMRNNENITSEIPVTEELMYQISEYLIPLLSRYDSKMSLIQIFANTESAIENIGAVGTGISCGVDSFHCILNNIKSKYKNFNLTHLVLNSVGSFHQGYKNYGIEKIKN